MARRHDPASRRRIIVSGLTAFLIVAAAAASRPPSYESSFTMMVGFQPREPLPLDIQRTTQLVRIHMELIRSVPVLRQVAITRAAPPTLDDATLGEAVERLQGSISTSSPPFTNLIAVTVRDRDEREVLPTAAALATQYRMWWANLAAQDDVIVLSPPSRPAPAAIGVRGWLTYAGLGLGAAVLLISLCLGWQSSSAPAVSRP